MCNYFFVYKNTEYSLGVGRACSLNGSNKKSLQNAGGGRWPFWRLIWKYWHGYCKQIGCS